MKTSEIKFGKAGDYVLLWEDQLKFKKWFMSTVKRNGINFTQDFYFDGVDCVDTTTGENIPCIDLIGKWLWCEGLIFILKHFNYITD